MDVNRRIFLQRSATLAVATMFGHCARAAAPAKPSRITHVSVQTANGRRLTPVAPNAYAPYRGYDVREPVLRIRTSDGLEGIGRFGGKKPEVLKTLIGMDPFALYEWDGETIRGATPAHAAFLDELAGGDVALLDLLGKAMHTPVADLLGKPVRNSVDVYDSSLYMEDLLKPAEREGLAYLDGKPAPDVPAELVALKAKWILAQPGSLRTLKIKLGRVKWMGDMDKACQRDIAVVKAIRKAVGPDVMLLVDGNGGYKSRPLAASDFAIATKDDKVYLLEQMFPLKVIEQTQEEKRRLRAAGLMTKLADGENERDGTPESVCAARFASAAAGHDEPLIDINQPDMNENGYLRMMAIARRSAGHGMTMSPHNFGSKWGFYSMLHLGLVTPNWEFCETDDSQFPALRPEGISIENGKAKLTGMPGVGIVLDETKLEKPTATFEA